MLGLENPTALNPESQEIRLKKALRTTGILRQYNQRASVCAEISLREFVFSSKPIVSYVFKWVRVESKRKRGRHTWKREKEQRIKPSY